MGRFNEAIAEIYKALELDPLSPIIHVAGALVYYYARQYEKTREMCHKSQELDPDFRGAHVWLSNFHKQMKNYDAYFSERLKAMTLGGEGLIVILLWKKMHEVYKTSGIEDAARYFIDVLKKAPESVDIKPSTFITSYVFLRDKEQLMDTLEKCYERRSWVLHLLKVNPDFDFIRSESRFKALLKRMKLDE